MPPRLSSSIPRPRRRPRSYLVIASFAAATNFVVSGLALFLHGLQRGSTLGVAAGIDLLVCCGSLKVFATTAKTRTCKLLLHRVKNELKKNTVGASATARESYQGCVAIPCGLYVEGSLIRKCHSFFSIAVLNSAQLASAASHSSTSIRSSSRLFSSKRSLPNLPRFRKDSVRSIVMWSGTYSVLVSLLMH
jgi:hypothetical protein